VTRNAVINGKPDMLYDSLNSSTDELARLVEQSTPVLNIVADPSEPSNCKYIVVVLDPRAPLIREVPVATENAFETLSDAKCAAREIICDSINIAQNSLVELRQLGINEIVYIKL
jgi:hypothetical protein